jgi:hypothetical protein
MHLLPPARRMATRTTVTRSRILQLVHPDDFSRFKTLGVIADFQLLWAKREPANEKPLEPYLGPERLCFWRRPPSRLQHGVDAPTSDLQFSELSRVRRRESVRREGHDIRDDRQVLARCQSTTLGGPPIL